MDKLNLDSNKAEMQPVYYWLDGYWITDKEEAELMDEINAFGSTHGVTFIEKGAGEETITFEVSKLIEN